MHFGASGWSTAWPATSWSPVYSDATGGRSLHLSSSGYVRLTGLGSVADAGGGVLGNASGRRADQRDVGDRLAPPGYTAAQALHLGGRSGNRKTGRPSDRHGPS